VSAVPRASDPDPIHLRPTAELAERVLLPGDPGRALALAQALLVEPRMFNHHRGLWGYTGEAPDGRPLTIQATGMGGPSAAIVFTELIALGAKRAIRVGTCGALARSLKIGDLVVAREALCLDGTSRALGASGAARADAPLTEALIRAAPSAHAGTIASVDLFYGDGPRSDPERHASCGAAPVAVEMEAATLFAIGAREHVAVACVLAVSDTFDTRGERARIDDRSLLQASERMGASAVEALTL
jgi:uridine phosphorylase